MTNTTEMRSETARTTQIPKKTKKKILRRITSNTLMNRKEKNTRG